MLKTVLKKDDVIGIEFYLGTHKLATISECDAVEDGFQWKSSLTMVSDKLLNNSWKTQSIETLEAESLESCILTAMQFLINDCNFGFGVIGRIQGHKFYLHDIKSTAVIVTEAS